MTRRALLGLGVVGAAGLTGLAGWRSLRPDPPVPGVPAPRRRAAEWTYETVGRGSIGSMSLQGGTLYLASDAAAPRVEALDARKGKSRWVAELPVKDQRGDLGGDIAQVKASDGRCFATAERGRVHVLSARDGSLLWSSEVLGDGVVQGTSVVDSTVCVGLGPVMSGGNPETSTVLVEAMLCGLDPSSGRRLWRAENSRLLHVDHSRGLLIAVTRSGSRIAALDASSGRRRWEIPLHGRMDHGRDWTTLGRTHLYVTLDGHETTVGAYTLDSGERTWTVTGSPAHNTTDPSAVLSLAPDERTLYACDSGTGGMSAYNCATGHRRWGATTDAPTAAGVLTSGQAVYVATADSYLGARKLDAQASEPDGLPGLVSSLFSEAEPVPGGYVTAFSASTGERLWHTVRDDACFSAPVQAGGAILVSHPKEVWAYDARTGTPRWRTAGESAASGAAPLVGDGGLYVTTASGVRAIRV